MTTSRCVHDHESTNAAMNYLDLPFNKKLNLLNSHDGGWRSLEDSKWCLHCNKSFTGMSARVYEQDGSLWLECGTPDCGGSPIDWAPYPWWDDHHPATIAWFKKHPDGIDHDAPGGSAGGDDIPF